MCVPVETTSNQDLISGAAFSFVFSSAASGGAAGSSSRYCLSASRSSLYVACLHRF
jgi:hypothetical protein